LSYVSELFSRVAPVYDREKQAEIDRLL